VLQKERELAALHKHVASKEQQIEIAEARAEETEELFAAWRQVQAYVMHTLPRREAGRCAAGKLTPSLSSRVPKQEELRFAHGPQSPLSAFADTLQNKENPLAIFQEVYGANRRPVRPSGQMHSGA
jgi:hypothetical protein